MSHRSPQSTLNGTQTQSTLQKLSTANEQTWLLIGRCAEQLSSLEHALSAYENALRHNPMSLPGLSQLAGIYRVKENYPKAIEYFQKVLALNEENGEVWSALGHCYLMQDDLQKAYSAYQQALYLLPNPKEDPKLWYGIGILYDRYGSLDHAEEAFSSVLRMDKDLDFDKANEILFRLGIIYKQQGKYNESLSCFDRILRNPPSPLAHADIWFQIGHVYEQQGDHARAKDAYERVVADNPTHAKVLQQLGWLYHQDGSGFQNQDLAIQYLTKSLEADSSDAQSWYLLGRAYMAGAKYNKAYEAYQQAVYRDGRNPTFWCSIGVLYFQINQFRDALDAYSRAIRINPYISEVWFDLGSLYESCNNQLGDAIDAYARAAELDPGNAAIKERLALLREAQRNGGVLPSGAGTSPTSPSAPNGSANGTGPDNRNGLGPAPIPQDVHPTAYASSVGPPGVSAFDRDRGPDRDRDRDRDRLPFTLLERERGERDRDRRVGGPPPPLLLTQPPSSSRGGEISLPPPSINGTSGPGVAANGATPSANGRSGRVELQPINLLGLTSSTSSSAIPGSPASTSYRGGPGLDDRDRDTFGSRRGPNLAPMDVDRPSFRDVPPRDLAWRERERDERARDLLRERDRDFPFRPTERERDRDRDREDRTVLLHQPIPERTNGISHHSTPHPQIQIPTQQSSSVRRTPATSPTSARPRSVQPQTGPALPSSRPSEGNPRVSPTLGPGGRSPRPYAPALPDRRSELGLGPGGSSVFYPPRSTSRASVASIERERERGDRDVIMRDVERDERGARYWEGPTSSRGMMGPGAPPPPSSQAIPPRSVRVVPEDTSPARYDRFMVPPVNSATAPTAATPHSQSSRSSESPHPSGSVSGDNGTPVGSSSKRKRGDKTEKAEETSSSAGGKKKKRASGKKKDDVETASFKLIPVNNSYDAETPDSKSSRRPSPAGVRIPNRVTDDDYDEPGVADALMGLSTFRAAKPPSPRYRGHSQHGSISSNRSHTSPTPQPSVNSKRPLSPSPDSDTSLKRSRMDVDKPSPPNSAVHPSGRRTPLPSTRPSPIPFLMQPSTQSPQQSDRERGYAPASPGLQSVVLPPHPRPIGANGGPQRRDSGSDQLPPIATLSPQSDTSERERELREKEEFQEWQRERRRIMGDNPRSSPSSSKRSSSPVAKKEDA